MTCAGFEERIARYVGGDLTPGEVAAIEQHLRACVDCAELVRGLEEDREWLASRPPEIAEVDFAAMRREIRREIARPRRAWKWLAVAAAIVLAVGLATSLRRTPAPPRIVPAPVVEQAVAPNTNRSLTVAAQKRVLKRRRVQAPRLVLQQPDSPVEIRIATRDPNVTIILLHESKGDSL
jgi:anti-sigma factor RsiW